MEKLTKGVTNILSFILIVLMAVMVLDVTWQVMTRFIMKNPSSFTEELAGYLLIWISLLGASYALHTRAHLGIDVLTFKLTGVKKQVVEISISMIVLLFAFFVMVIGGLRLVNLTLTLNQISPAMGLKMGYVYLVIPVTGILFIYYSIDFIVQAIKKKPAVVEKQHFITVE